MESLIFLFFFCLVFSKKQFKIGIEYKHSIHRPSLNGFDYITIWLNTNSLEINGLNYHTQDYIQMLEKCRTSKKTPVFYSYVIAFEARTKQGLHDCDVIRNSYNLCTHGSCFVREFRAHLVQAYENHARIISEHVGKYAQVVFLIEPDFWQYYGDPRQKCALTGLEMRALFIDFVKAIRTFLPRSEMSWDVSSWLSQEQFCEWY